VLKYHLPVLFASLSSIQVSAVSASFSIPFVSGAVGGRPDVLPARHSAALPPYSVRSLPTVITTTTTSTNQRSSGGERITTIVALEPRSSRAGSSSLEPSKSVAFRDTMDGGPSADNVTVTKKHVSSIRLVFSIAYVAFKNIIS